MAAVEPTAPNAGRPSARRARWWTALGLCALLATTAACGARWSDEERAAVIARSSGGGGGSGDEIAGPGETTTTVAGDAAGGGGTGGTGGGSTTGGAGGTGGTGGSGGASGPLPCAAASKAPGVTDERITTGNISTLSGPIPGLGESSVAAVRAYVAYRNSTGGVCGRQLALKAGDDGAENGRFRSILTDMSSQVLGLSGGFGAGDGGGVDVLTAGGIPAVATAFSDQFQAAPTVFDINPPFENVHTVIGKFKYLYDHGVRTASFITLATSQSQIQLDQQQAQSEAAGIKTVNRQDLPLSTLSYDAAARSVANSKADYMLFLSAASSNSSMARSMKDTGYKLKFAEYLTAYGSSFIELAGPEAAEGAVSWIRTVPNEETGNPEQKAFLAWMARVAPGVNADTFAADAWASAKAFFNALEALPGPITRAALVKQLKSIALYDADGFMGPIKLGAKRTQGCVIAMRVVKSKWQRLAPGRGFLC